MSQKRARGSRWIGFAAVLCVMFVGLILLRRESTTPPMPPSATANTSVDATTPQADAAPQAAGSLVSGGQRDGGEDARQETGGTDVDMDQDMIALRWAQVDLDALRDAMPDNLYWKLGAPTSDPAVERERAEERARWNEAYGKVLSGTASEDEIHAYYDQRAHVSADYVEFASRVLEDYGDVLPARDVGLLELSLKMHHARLQQMPRRLTEALERKQRQDRLREAWLADEEAFERAQADEVQRAHR